MVTSTFVFEGDGRVQEYVGGYEDWVRQRLAEKGAAAKKARAAAEKPSEPAAEKPKTTKIVVKTKKLSFKEASELANMEGTIEIVHVQPGAT